MPLRKSIFYPESEGRFPFHRRFHSPYFPGSEAKPPLFVSEKSKIKVINLNTVTILMGMSSAFSLDLTPNVCRKSKKTRVLAHPYDQQHTHYEMHRC